MMELVIMDETRVVQHLEKPVTSVGSLVILQFVAEPKQIRSVQVENRVLMELIKLQRNQKKKMMTLLL